MQQPLSLQDYTVRKGDTLDSIAKRHNLTSNFLASANRLKDPNSLRVGQSIVVAAPQLAPKAPAPAAAATSPAVGAVPKYISPLLNVIRSAESNVAGYDTMVGSNKPHGLTSKTIADVMAYQQQYKKQYPNRTAAAGAYQLIPGTMKEVITRMKIDPAKTLYDQQTQDRIAYELMKNRGLYSYLQGKLPLNKIRLNIAKEWAGLPAKGDKSYYSGVGNNRANVPEKSYLDALNQMKSLYNSLRQK